MLRLCRSGTARKDGQDLHPRRAPMQENTQNAAVQASEREVRQVAPCPPEPRTLRTFRKAALTRAGHARLSIPALSATDLS